MQKAKESTARINLWNELKCDNVFTLEASFASYMFEVITFNICLTLLGKELDLHKRRLYKSGERFL